MKTTAALTALSIALAGCATASKDIATTSVSPLQYHNYDCSQLSAEAMRLNTRVQQMGGRLDQAATNDKALMAVTLLLFWPAAFALGGNKQQEAEYGQLKGEAEAVQQAAIAKKCPGLMTASTGPAGSPALQPAVAPAAGATLQPVVAPAAATSLQPALAPAK